MVMILRAIAAQHQHASVGEKGFLEAVARRVADYYGYQYDNMNLHLASMWPKLPNTT